MPSRSTASSSRSRRSAGGTRAESSRSTSSGPVSPPSRAARRVAAAAAASSSACGATRRAPGSAAAASAASARTSAASRRARRWCASPTSSTPRASARAESAAARRLRPAERQAGARGAPGASHQAGGDRAGGDLVHAVPRDETRSLRERHDARPGGGGEHARERPAGIRAGDDQGRRRAAERRQRPAHLARQRGRLPCGGVERPQPGEPPAAPEGERARGAVGDHERLVVAGRGQEVPGREGRQVDARGREPGAGQQRAVRLQLVTPDGGGEHDAPAGRGPERLARDGEARRIERELPQQLERRGAREAPAVAEGEGEEAVGRGGGGQRGEYDVGTGARELGEHPRERRRARERPALERGQAQRAEAALAARHAQLAGGDLEPEEPRHDAPPSGSVTAVASSMAPPAPSSTPSVSSTARGSAGAVHAAFHTRPSKQRTRNVRTPARASIPAGSCASGGAKRPPSRRTSTPGPGAAASTR